MVNGSAAKQLAFCILAASLGAFGWGCAVGQRPGNGSTLHLQEPVTGAWYWLYLPEDYVKNRNALLTRKRWPVVVTFHGMKPFDNASPQVREWQQEADRYGFLICAPHLKTPDLMYEFPFRRITPSLEHDERITIAVLDHLMAATDMDPNAVLSTSWSSGGYLAHYMINRHPDRFSCLAVRQSNFSADILDPARVPEYRDNKIAIFFTQNDFAVCRRESREGAQWYSRHGFDLTFAKFSSLGHERTPSVAAAFFARTCGAKAKTPPTELARMQVKEVPIELDGSTVLAQSSGRPISGKTLGPNRGDPSAARRHAREVTMATSPYPRADGRRPGEASSRRGARTGSHDVQSPGRARRSLAPLRTTPLPPVRSTRPTRIRSTPKTPKVDASPVRVRLSSTIGVAPLLISYSAVLPGDMRRSAYFLWTDNGEPVSNGINGQKYLTQPGEHRLEVLVTTADGKEFRAGQTVVVLKPITRRRAGT